MIADFQRSNKIYSIRCIQFQKCFDFAFQYFECFVIIQMEKNLLSLISFAMIIIPVLFGNVKMIIIEHSIFKRAFDLCISRISVVQGGSIWCMALNGLILNEILTFCQWLESAVMPRFFSFYILNIQSFVIVKGFCLTWHFAVLYFKLEMSTQEVWIVKINKIAILSFHSIGILTVCSAHLIFSF